ncbi:MAG: TonB-dependent receptor [Saprospiraceae bacterium]|nr:TonB-dependent receptor [Saprospiraceae bacterium]
MSIFQPAHRYARFLIPLFLFSSQLVAQTAEDSISLKTVVIQATRAGASSPVPHNNLSAEKLARYHQAQDVPYLLSTMPSVVENSDAGTGIGYTGLRIRGSDPTRVNVTINGVPLNDAESQGVFWVNLPDLASSASEIQVQRGVGSSTNGAGSFGATVNLDLSRISPTPFATLSQTLGSFRTSKSSLYMGSGLLNNHFAFSARLSTVRSDGYVDRASAKLNGLHVSGAYIDDKQSFTAHLLSGKEITYQAWNGLPVQYADVDSLRTYNSAGAEKPGEPYNNEVDDYTQRHYLLHYKRLLGSGFSLQLNGHYTRGFGYFEQYKGSQDFADYALDYPVLGDSTLENTDLVRRRWLDNHFYGGTFALRRGFAEGNVLMLGGAFSRYEGRHYGEIIWAEYAIPKDYVYYDNNAAKNDGNVFLKYDWTVNNKLSLMADMQYRFVQYNFLGYNQDLENVDQKADLHFFNPKAGYLLRLTPHWTTMGFFGVANREPNREDFTQSSPQSRPKPERLYNLELGVKTNRENWNLGLNVFGMYYRDQLVLDGKLNDVGAFTRTNVPESYRAGFELEGVWQMAQQWSMQGNATLSQNRALTFDEYIDNWDTFEQQVVEHKNTPLAFSPSWIAQAEILWMAVENNRHRFTTSLRGKYVGKQYLDNTGNEITTLPDYFTTDIRFNYDIKNIWGGELSFILSVNNLLDAGYFNNGWTYRFQSPSYDPRTDDPYARLEQGNTYNLTGLFPQAGRNIMATVLLRL